MTTPLLDLVPNLRKIASTAGGEYAGPCPLCGGKDRFHVQPAYAWQDGDTGAWFCRQCSPHWQDAPALIMRLYNVRYPEALRILGQPPSPSNGRGAGGEGPRPPAAAVPPDATWQTRAAAFAGQAHDCLWSTAGERARAWLHQRGFTDPTLHAAGVGYHPADTYDAPDLWGLPDTAGRVYLPRGITLPWAEVLGGDVVWNIEIRRPITDAQAAQGERKYHSIKGGSKQVLMLAEDLDAAPTSVPVILVEGFFDLLALAQCNPLPAIPVAAGSTTGARQSTWLTRLATRQVLLAFDADDAGDEGAAWWLQVLGGRAVRWRPDPGYKDPAAMLQAGADLRAWVQAGLAYAAGQKASPRPPVGEGQGEGLPSTDTDPCAICGAPFDRYDPTGRPLCADHYAAWQASTPYGQPPVVAPQPPRVKLYPIPPRSRPQRCDCGAEFYWVVVNDKPLPIAINTDLHPDCVAPTHDAAGAGINHFADCPRRDQHRKAKPPALSHPLDQPQPTTTTTEAA